MKLATFYIYINYGGRDMKRYLLKKLARAAEYTAERGQGWPTYWGFHELVADANVKEMIKKKKHDKTNYK